MQCLIRSWVGKGFPIAKTPRDFYPSPNILLGLDLKGLLWELGGQRRKGETLPGRRTRAVGALDAPAHVCALPYSNIQAHLLSQGWLLRLHNLTWNY